MAISIRPVDPARPHFAAEVSGIDLTQPLGPDEVGARSRREWTASPCWCSTTRRSTTRSSSPSAAISARWSRRPATSRKARQRRLSMEVNDISNLDQTTSVLARDDRQRLFGLGNMLWHSDSSFKPTPAKYLAALGAHHPAAAAATPSSPTCAPPRTRWTTRPRRWCATWSASTARSIRAACWASPTSPRRSGASWRRCRSAWCAAIRVTGRRRCSSPPTPARSSAGRCRKRAPCCATSPSTRRSASSSMPTVGGSTFGDVGQPRHHAPRAALRRSGCATCAGRRLPTSRLPYNRRPDQDLGCR